MRLWYKYNYSCAGVSCKYYSNIYMHLYFFSRGYVCEQQLFHSHKMLAAIKIGTKLPAACVNLSQAELTKFWMMKLEGYFGKVKKEYG